MRESNVLREVWLAVSPDTVLFRLNTGKGIVSGGGKIQWLQDGTALVPFARPISLGFGMPNGDALVGASDLIGWTVVTVTQEMVGKRLAVLTAVETKASGGGHKRDAQKVFIENVKRAGGLAGFASSPDQALEIIKGAV